MPTLGQFATFGSMALFFAVIFWSYRSTSQVLWDDYQASVEDAKHAEANLQKVLATPSMVDSLLVTGQWVRDNALEAILTDGRETCIARQFEDIAPALVQLRSVGIDTQEAERILAKLTAKRAAKP